MTNPEPAPEPGSYAGNNPGRLRKFTFNLRDALFVLTIIAIGLAWWSDRSQKQTGKYDVQGPIDIHYEYQVSDSTRKGRRIGKAAGINFADDKIIVYTENGGVVIPIDSLVNFNWNRY